jgi:hypothetical protein
MIDEIGMRPIWLTCLVQAAAIVHNGWRSALPLLVDLAVH